MKSLILLLILFKIDAHKTHDDIIDTFDIIEINHVHNEWGVETLAQIVVWDWIPNQRSHHVQWWRGMQNCRIRGDSVKEQEDAWNKKRRRIADSIKDWPTRKDFLDNSTYRGEFDRDHKWIPKLNNKTGYWEIQYTEKHIIRAKHFQETYTDFDVEHRDSKEWPARARKGLTKVKSGDADPVIIPLPFVEELLNDFIGPPALRK